MLGPLSRRQLFQVAALGAVGWAAAQLLHRAAPVGRDVASNRTARRLLADRTSPRADVPGADLTMVVFTDYRCPACRFAHPAMKAAIAADGRVRLIFRDWPIFGEPSKRAARVAIASDRQGIYPAVHDALMADRREIDDDMLRDTIERAGGQWEGILAVLQSESDLIDARLLENARDAGALGLAGTPGYLIGTILVAEAIDQHGFEKAFARARMSAS